MRIEIELKGFGDYGWKVCDNCILHADSDPRCRLGFEPKFGILNTSTGNTTMGSELRRGDDGYWVDIRPQECIDKHGR